MQNNYLKNEERLEFISQLRDAFMTTKGYGIYAYLNPIDVNNLFEQYTKTNMRAKDFAKKFVSSMI